MEREAGEDRDGAERPVAARDWRRRPFGATGLEVSALGFGAGQIGDDALDERDVEALLNGALDSGVTLIDTARGYGLSEERIGRHLAHRRSEFVLSTKVGYAVPGYVDWTGPCITAGVDAALGRMRTDWIDVVHLHTCPLGVLEHGEVIEALEGAVAAGKVRVAAYSGDNQEIDWAVGSGRFGSVQTSINVFDQRALDGAVAVAAERGLGCIAKRPVGNVPWRFAERPAGEYCEEYWVRMKAMGLDPSPFEWQELALRFAAWAPGVHTSIVGTRSLEHLRRNADLVARGPLPDERVREIRDAFRARDQGWTQQV